MSLSIPITFNSKLFIRNYTLNLYCIVEYKSIMWLCVNIVWLFVCFFQLFLYNYVGQRNLVTTIGESP